MAKKDKKSSKKEKPPEASDVVDRVRGAVERTFQATSESAGPARDMGRSLLDEVASAATRIRESFDDLRVLEDVRGMRSEIEALSKRVTSLEQQLQAAATSTTAAPAASAPAAAKPAASPARKPAARKPAARKPAASKPSGTAKPAAAKSSASKPRSARAKPASGS